MQCPTRRPARVRLIGCSILVVAAACCGAIGCGNTDPIEFAEQAPVFKAKGTLHFNGQPLPGAKIVLHPVDSSGQLITGGRIVPRAFVTQDGSFEIYTYKSGDGAPAGDYIVTVSLKDGGDDAEEDGKPRPQLMPDEYTRPQTSSLRAEILLEEQNVLPPFQLKGTLKKAAERTGQRSRG